MNKANILSVVLTLTMVLSVLTMAAPRVAHANGASIEVEKRVWDGHGWVENITANISDNVTFQCEIHNDGDFMLTNITVTDILPQSLNFTGSDVTPYNVTSNPDGTTTIEWKAYFLDTCDSIRIHVDAHVVECGVDINNQTAVAWCGDTGEWVDDWDTATVNVPCPPLPPPAGPTVPTLSQWGMIIMASLFAVVLVWMGRRRGLARRG